MSGKKITELGSKSGLIQNHKIVVADSNGIAYQTDYLGVTTGATWDGINTATFNRNDGNSYNLGITSLSGSSISGNTFFHISGQYVNELKPSAFLLWQTQFTGNNASTSNILPENSFVVITSGSGGVSLPYQPGSCTIYITNNSGNSGFIYGNSFDESILFNGGWTSSVSSIQIADGSSYKLTYIRLSTSTNVGRWLIENFNYGPNI